MACRLVGAKPLSEQMKEYFSMDWGTNPNEILIEIHAFSFKKIHKWQPFCLCYNVLRHITYSISLIMGILILLRWCLYTEMVACFFTVWPILMSRRVILFKTNSTVSLSNREKCQTDVLNTHLFTHIFPYLHIYATNWWLGKRLTCHNRDTAVFHQTIKIHVQP